MDAGSAWRVAIPPHSLPAVPAGSRGPRRFADRRPRPAIRASTLTRPRLRRAAAVAARQVRPEPVGPTSSISIGTPASARDQANATTASITSWRSSGDAGAVIAAPMVPLPQPVVTGASAVAPEQQGVGIPAGRHRVRVTSVTEWPRDPPAGQRGVRSGHQNGGSPNRSAARPAVGPTDSCRSSRYPNTRPSGGSSAAARPSPARWASGRVRPSRSRGVPSGDPAGARRARRFPATARRPVVGAVEARIRRREFAEGQQCAVDVTVADRQHVFALVAMAGPQLPQPANPSCCPQPNLGEPVGFVTGDTWFLPRTRRRRARVCGFMVSVTRSPTGPGPTRSRGPDADRQHCAGRPRWSGEGERAAVSGDAELARRTGQRSDLDVGGTGDEPCPGHVDRRRGREHRSSGRVDVCGNAQRRTLPRRSRPGSGRSRGCPGCRPLLGTCSTTRVVVESASTSHVEISVAVPSYARSLIGSPASSAPISQTCWPGATVAGAWVNETGPPGAA